MASSPVPLTSAEEIRDLLHPLFDLECRFDEFDPLKIRRIRKKIEELAAIDRMAADSHLASLQTLLYDYPGARAAVDNLAANNHVEEHLLTYAKVQSNFLFGTEAQGLLDVVVERGLAPTMAGLFELAAAVGAFRLICRAVDKANAENRTMQAASKLIPISRKVAPVLDHFGITDADVAACIDEAGVILREHRLLWLHTRPDVFVSDLDSDDPGVSLEYSLAVTPSKAAELNDRLADVLIEKDLFKPGFTLGFLGVRDEH